MIDQSICVAWALSLSRSSRCLRLYSTVTCRRPLVGKQLQLINQFTIESLHLHRLFLFLFFLRRSSTRRRTMKQDLSLSLLSRGRGRFVSSTGHEGRQDGRLDVCFTPQVSTKAVSHTAVVLLSWKPLRRRIVKSSSGSSSFVSLSYDWCLQC